MSNILSESQPAFLTLNKNYSQGAGVVAQQLKALAALAEVWGSVPSAHTGWFTTSCNSDFGESNSLFWLLQTLAYI